MSFSINVAKWAKNAGETVDETNKAIIIGLFRAVVKDTPVLEGRLRGNWIITKDSPSGETIDGVDKSGGLTIKKMVDFVSNLDDLKNVNVFFTNNMPYARRIEEGYSKVKAPHGMVRKNLIQVASNFNSA